jgi:GntR family transcriptional regulator, vanillate catabolism transcriptional regulator
MNDLPALPTAIVRQQFVVDQLREMIMTNVFAEGDRLLEVALSKQLQVSRTPIREALIILSEDGLVEYRPNKGYVVRSFTLPYIVDAYTVRESLEGLACRLAAERGVNIQTRKAIEACLAEGDRLLSVERLKDSARVPLREVNDAFHRMIIGSAGNAVLSQSLSAATNIPYSSTRIVHWYKEKDPTGLYQLRNFHAQHHAIFRAICAGEGYRAETVMRGHIAEAADQIQRQFATAEKHKKKGTTNSVGQALVLA